VRALRHDFDELLDRIVGDGSDRSVPQRRSWWRSARSPLSPLASLLDRLARAKALSKSALAHGSEEIDLLTEHADCFLVRVDLHDVRERDVDVRLEGEVLTISGERHHQEAKREQGCAYTERRYNSFTRTIELPRGVDSHRVEAHYREGLLEVLLPKRESPRIKQIPIVRHVAYDVLDKHESRRVIPHAAPRSAGPTTATA
jgi:HSP20 family molecular chaperone IbpA